MQASKLLDERIADHWKRKWVDSAAYGWKILVRSSSQMYHQMNLGERRLLKPVRAIEGLEEDVASIKF